MRGAPVSHPVMAGKRAQALVAALLLASWAVTPAHAASRSGWQALPPLPTPSVGLTALRLPDRSIVALGGDATLGSQASMAARFVPGQSAWQRLPRAPFALDTPAALALSSHAVFVVAPSFANGTISAPSKAAILDPVWQRWIALPACPVPLVAPHVLLLNSHTVLAVGGVGNPIGATFDLTTLHWTDVVSPVPNLAGYSIASVPDRGALFMMSVAINVQRQPFGVQQAWLLSPGGQWRQVARPPVLVDGAQAVALDAGHILFAGGYPLGDDPRLAAPPALLYDVQANHWTIAGATGTDHRGALLVALGHGRAFLVGGHGPDGSPSAGCLIFTGSRWLAAHPLPGAWAGYAVVETADGGLMLIGGIRPNARGFAAGADTMLLQLDTPGQG